MTASIPPKDKQLNGPWKGAHFSLWGLEERAGRRGGWRIAVSRQVVPLATERNRWKRRIREVLRRCPLLTHPGRYITLRVDSTKGRLTPAELEKEISSLLRQARILNERDE